MLEGKKLLITGVANEQSLGFAIARRALALGAEIVLSAPPRDVAGTRVTAEALACEVLPLDLTDDGDRAGAVEAVGRRWGRLDGAVHAVAFAPRDALDGDFLAARADSITVAFRTSVVTYAGLAGMLAELAPAEGAGLVGLDFDGGGAWPTYNWMGVCKAALRETSSYVARDLGARGVRSNLVAAGPLRTRAAGHIPGFDRLLDAWERRSPLAWSPSDAGPVADAVCFLLSDLARQITGEVLHVDGGFHAIAAELRPAGAPPAVAGSPAGALPDPSVAAWVDPPAAVAAGLAPAGAAH